MACRCCVLTCNGLQVLPPQQMLLLVVQRTEVQLAHLAVQLITVILHTNSTQWNQLITVILDTNITQWNHVILHTNTTQWNQPSLSSWTQT